MSITSARRIAATVALQNDRFMLQEDVDRFVQAAQASRVGN
jgi:hypothetical protein